MFVCQLNKQIDQPVLLIWDRLPGHRSRLVQDYLASLKGKIDAFYHAAYAPELIRRVHLRPPQQHDFRNFWWRDLWSLRVSPFSPKLMQRRPRIVTACWKEASLF